MVEEGGDKGALPRLQALAAAIDRRFGQRRCRRLRRFEDADRDLFPFGDPPDLFDDQVGQRHSFGP